MRFPVFPMHSVLLPKAIARLEISEERFMQMIYQCQKTSTPFGTILLSGNTVHRVGCMAHIEHTVNTEKKIDIGIKGGQRFILKKIDHSGNYPLAQGRLIAKDRKPLFTAKIPFIEKIYDYYHTLSTFYNFGTNVHTLRGFSMEECSFFLSAMDIFSTQEKQKFLELRSTKKRLLIIRMRLLQIIDQQRDILRLQEYVTSPDEIQHILN